MDDLSSTIAPSLATLRATIEAFTAHAFVTFDSDERITSWNVGAERLLGHSREYATGQHVSLIFTPQERESGAVQHALRHAEREGPIATRQWLIRSDGVSQYVNATIVACRDEAGAVAYAMLAHSAVPADGDDARLQDIMPASVEEHSQRLAEVYAMLRAEIADRTQTEAARLRLLRRLVAAEEEERRRLARDLHDDLGQRLTALRLTLEGSEAHSDRSDAIAKSLQLLANIDQGLDFLAWELRPAALDELGLTKVLDNYVHEWSQHVGIRALFHSATPRMERFASEIESSVYRITQEALNNVAKHADAQSVNVLLEQRGEEIVLVIEDDGVGLPRAEATDKMTGVAGMRERSAAVGGTLEFEPTPNGGTTVLVRIPVAGGSRDGAAVARAVMAAAGVTLPGALPGESDGAVLDSVRARLQEVQHALVARDEFIATVAHELRNPVAPLMFQIRLAIDKSEQMASSGESVPTDWVQSQLRRIEQRLHRLLEMLDRLLDVSRLSTGRIDLQPESVNLALAVSDVLNTFEAELGVARCRVGFSQRGDAVGWWDRMRVEQICQNLLSNAIRFGAGRPIAISVEADQDFAILRVRDEGVGIAPELHTRIFERFERGVEQRSGGFGIGLWVVKNICLAMGGTIGVDSQPGQGACFTVMLPRRNERESIDSRSERT
jgi:PAS domain S-box-containing protein